MKPWKIWCIFLVVAALCLAWTHSTAAVDEPDTAKPEAPDTPKQRSPDFTNPVTAVTAFLTALKTGDRHRLAEIISIYVSAPTNGAGETQRKLLTAIREETASDVEIKQLASAFEGYEIAGLQNNVKASMILQVYVRKRVTNGASLLRAVTTRAERRGWKVLDFSEPKELEKGSPYAAAERRNETYPDIRSAAGQGRAAARGSTTASAGGRLMDFLRFAEALVFKFADETYQGN
jgi:hypothetical protein